MGKITEWLEINSEVPYSDLEALNHALKEVQRLQSASHQESQAAATGALKLWSELKKQKVKRLEDEVRILTQQMQPVKEEFRPPERSAFYAEKMRKRHF
jgi:hypothetical protein